jgi:hypothetical protein
MGWSFGGITDLAEMVRFGRRRSASQLGLVATRTPVSAMGIIGDGTLGAGILGRALGGADQRDLFTKTIS